MIGTWMRIRIVGIVLIVAGLGVAAGGFAYGLPQANDGLDSAQAMYESQGVSLSYNEQGQLVDRGTVEGANAIMSLLVDEWKYPVDRSNFDAADPLVNTRDELMFQYATIVYHVLHAKVNVSLSAAQVPITFRGVTYSEPGHYMIEVGAYYGELDRTHPIEGQLRAAWSPLALSLTSYLAAGHANQAAGELAFFLSLGMGSVGLLFALAGAGLVWVSVRPRQRAGLPPGAKARPVEPGRAAENRPGKREAPLQVAHHGPSNGGSGAADSGSRLLVGIPPPRPEKRPPRPGPGHR
jgi:hypothetical protein